MISENTSKDFKPDVNVNYDSKAITKIQLRDDVISQIGQYCSDLSHQLFIEFTTEIVPKILDLEWTDDLYQDFLTYRRQIDRMGLERAGHIILLNLREHIK